MDREALLAAFFACSVSCGDPPARYDHPFDGIVIMQWENNPEPREWGADLYGYTTGNKGGICTVYVNTKFYKKLDQILRHEIAHCNGWPSDHPK